MCQLWFVLFAFCICVLLAIAIYNVSALGILLIQPLFTNTPKSTHAYLIPWIRHRELRILMLWWVYVQYSMSYLYLVVLLAVANDSPLSAFKTFIVVGMDSTVVWGGRTQASPIRNMQPMHTNILKYSFILILRNGFVHNLLFLMGNESEQTPAGSVGVQIRWVPRKDLRGRPGVGAAEQGSKLSNIFL